MRWLRRCGLVDGPERPRSAMRADDSATPRGRGGKALAPRRIAGPSAEGLRPRSLRRPSIREWSTAPSVCRRSSPPPEDGALAGLVGFEVVLEMNAGIGRSVSLLRTVLEVDLGKCKTHGLRRGPRVVASMHDAGDQDIVQLDDEELLLALARLAMGDGGFLQMPARGARSEKAGRCLVDLVNDGEVLEGGLSGAGSAARTVACRIDGAPRERQHLDLVLVLAVEGFAFDIADLGKDIDSHRTTLPLIVVTGRSQCGAESRDCGR